MNKGVAVSRNIVGVASVLFGIFFLLTLFIAEIQFPPNVYRVIILFSLPVLAIQFIYYNGEPHLLTLTRYELFIVISTSLVMAIFVSALAFSFLPFIGWLFASLGFLLVMIFFLRLWR